MVKGKLILICQSGGNFLKNDDGSMSYAGGEAHAVDISPETQFDDLKLKLAELLNLEYKTVSIKYFLPGNRRTPITLATDRDLKRMYEFHENSVTADVFVSGKEGFNREVLNMSSRTNEIKLAETVSPKRQAVRTPSAATKARRLTSVSAPADSVLAIQLSTQNFHEDAGADCSMATGSVATATGATSHSPIASDINSTPADTVKKRRRTASWTISANGPKIVALAEKTDEKRKVTPRKKEIRKHNAAVVADDVEHHKDESDDFFLVDDSGYVPPEKLVASWKNSITGEGQDFISVKEFRDALQKYAIAHRFAYKLIKNDTNRASARCVAEGCPWRIHASWVPSTHSFRIKKLTTPHTCEGESWKSAHPSKNWLVSIIKDRLRDNPNHKPKEIATGILQDFGIELNYTQVWRGMEDAREQLQGSYKEAYNQLPALCDKMVEANPGSFVKIIISDDKRFQRLFISFHALVHGFQVGCRPLLFLDATSLKSKYHEVLLTATSLDGEDGAFPVAFCIVDNENDDNWLWFLEQLKHAITTSQPVTFVSDREKELKQYVLTVFENVHHGYSMYRLLESFKKNLKGPFYGEGKGSLPVNFLAAAHALRLDGFKKSTEQIKKVSPAAYDWVMQIEPEQWTSALFKGERYNHIMFNGAELYANWIEEARELTITQKVEKLRCKTMELINDRRIDSCRWSAKLTPSKEEKLQEEALKAKGLGVLFSSDTLFEVHDDSNHVVDIDKWECTCLKWKVTGLPCRHAIAVFNCTHRDMYDYCSRYFTVDNFLRMYSEYVNAVPEDFKNSEEATEGTEIVLPPSISKPPAENKKTENQTSGKSENKTGDGLTPIVLGLSARSSDQKEKEPTQVVKKTVTCTKCKGVGHNKATCTETS